MAPRRKEVFKEMQEASRERILMAAFGLFAVHGYAQTSVDSIAAKAKISKGLIYHYFKSKQDILKGLFALLMQDTAMMIGWAHSLPPKEFLQKLIGFSIHYITEKPKINRLMIALAVQPDVIRGLRKELEKARVEWMQVLTALFTGLGVEDPEGEAYFFGAIFDGMSIGFLTINQDYPVEKLKKIIEKRYGL